MPSWKNLTRMAFFDLLFSPNSRMLAAGGGDDGGPGDVVVVWDVGTCTQLWSVEARAVIEDMQFAPDSTRLYSFERDSFVRVLSCETGRVLFEIECLKSNVSDVRSLALSGDGNQLATVQTRTIQLWDALTGSLRHTIQEIIGVPHAGASFSPDARRLAVSTRYRAWFVDTTTGARVGTLPRVAELYGDYWSRGCQFTTPPFRR